MLSFLNAKEKGKTLHIRLLSQHIRPSRNLFVGLSKTSWMVLFSKVQLAFSQGCAKRVGCQVCSSTFAKRGEKRTQLETRGVCRIFGGHNSFAPFLRTAANCTRRWITWEIPCQIRRPLHVHLATKVYHTALSPALHQQMHSQTAACNSNETQLQETFPTIFLNNTISPCWQCEPRNHSAGEVLPCCCLVPDEKHEVWELKENLQSWKVFHSFEGLFLSPW